GLGGVLVDDFCASGRGFGLASFRDVDNNPDDGWPPVQLQPGREDFYLDRAAIGMASRDVTPHTAKLPGQLRLGKSPDGLEGIRIKQVVQAELIVQCLECVATEHGQ